MSYHYMQRQPAEAALLTAFSNKVPLHTEAALLNVYTMFSNKERILMKEHQMYNGVSHLQRYSVQTTDLAPLRINGGTPVILFQEQHAILDTGLRSVTPE